MSNILDSFKFFLLILLIIYSTIISILYLDIHINASNYQKERENTLMKKEKELTNRESIVVDKEICFRELTKLKTIQSTALDVLKSYSSDQFLETKSDSSTKTIR